MKLKAFSNKIKMNKNTDNEKEKREWKMLNFKRRRVRENVFKRRKESIQ